MTREDIRERADNKLVDFVSAIVAGLGIWFLDFSNTPQFMRDAMGGLLFQRALIKVGSFALAALVLLAWKNRWRVRWGWIMIAAVAVIITATIDEFIYRRTVTEPDFFAGFSPFPMEIVLFLLPALAVMGVTHFLGLMIQRRLGRSVNSV